MTGFANHEERKAALRALASGHRQWALDETLDEGIDDGDPDQEAALMDGPVADFLAAASAE